MAYYDRCDRYFNTERALEAHERDSVVHNICSECNNNFPSWTGLKEHWVQSTRHSYCQYDDHFYDEDDLEEHYQQYHYYCGSCNKVFKREDDREKHYRQSPNHNYCVPCQRDFQSPANLTSHLNSSIHRPKDVICPLKGCGRAFVSNAALILHFESGNCGSGMDRRTLNKFVRQYDKNNVITDPSRILTNGGDDGVTYYASSAAWNGHSYECYICIARIDSYRVESASCQPSSSR